MQLVFKNNIKMKKALAIVALVAAMFVAGKVQAQSHVYATYSPETFVSSFSNNGSSESTNFQGFSVGFMQNVDIFKGLGVAVGGQFRMNTRSESGTGILLNGTIKETQTIIDVPIMLNYCISVNKEFKIVPMAGVMPSIGLTGTTKTTTNVNGTTAGTTTTTDWYADGANKTNRFNLYAVVGLDLKYSNFNLFGGYRFGMLDLASNDNVKMTTNGMFVGIGWTL